MNQLLAQRAPRRSLGRGGAGVARGGSECAAGVRKEQVGDRPRGLEEAPRGHPPGPHLDGAALAEVAREVHVAMAVRERVAAERPPALRLGEDDERVARTHVELVLALRLVRVDGECVRLCRGARQGHGGRRAEDARVLQRLLRVGRGAQAVLADAHDALRGARLVGVEERGAQAHRLVLRLAPRVAAAELQLLFGERDGRLDVAQVAHDEPRLCAALAKLLQEEERLLLVREAPLRRCRVHEERKLVPCVAHAILAQREREQHLCRVVDRDGLVARKHAHLGAGRLQHVRDRISDRREAPDVRHRRRDAHRRPQRRER